MKTFKQVTEARKAQKKDKGEIDLEDAVASVRYHLEGALREANKVGDYDTMTNGHISAVRSDIEKLMKKYAAAQKKIQYYMKDDDRGYK